MPTCENKSSSLIVFCLIAAAVATECSPGMSVWESESCRKQFCIIPSLSACAKIAWIQKCQGRRSALIHRLSPEGMVRVTGSRSDTRLATAKGALSSLSRQHTLLVAQSTLSPILWNSSLWATFIETWFCQKLFPAYKTFTNTFKPSFGQNWSLCHPICMS